MLYHSDMGSRYEFDKDHQVLLVSLDGRLSEDSLGSLTRAAEKYWAATKPRAEIIDCSGVTEFAISSDRIRQLAKRQQLMPEAADLPRVIVVPETHAYGLARMYQIVAEQKRPLVTVVRSMDAALAALGITSPHFEPLD
jgi:anti-anti-sigma regulatory factor